MAVARTQARFALWIRALGATGLFVALLGLIPLSTVFSLTDADAWQREWTRFRTDLPTREFTDLYNGVGFLMLLGGGFVAAVALLYLMLNGLGTFAARRNFAKSNSALQTLLAVVLLVGVNVYSFRHYLRLDFTRDRQFTLPPEIAGELAKLRPDDKTTIVVYQRYKTFSRLSDKPDANDYAAGRKVVEKVQDLVEQFREFGPQFRVEILDVEAEGFEEKLAELTAESKALRAALDAAPENSIVFHTGHKTPDGRTVESVQRLGFDEFYQLDKARSKELANLVLLPQGVGPFAARVLAIEERKPRVGFAVIHEYLSSEGPDEYSLAGAKKALQAQGFEVVDFVLKKWGTSAPEPEPAAYTLDESKYEALEEQIAEIDAAMPELQKAKQQLTAIVELFRTTSLEELTKRFRDQLQGQPFTEEMRKFNIDRRAPNLDAIESALRQNAEARKQLEAERDATGQQERLVEERRQTDLKAKLLGLLSECDLLVVPRMTLRDVVSNDVIRARLYRPSDIQLVAVKEFLTSGKPVRACSGPPAEPAAPRRPTPPAGPDSLEELLKPLGIEFGKQTVLFDSDSKSFAERRTNIFATGSKNKPPALLFQPSAGRGAIFTPDDPAKPPPSPLPANPLASGMAVLKRNVGGDEFDLELKHPRPVYYVPAKGSPPSAEAGFLFTDAAAWNEANPFPTRERTPRYEPPKPDDPAKNTPDEKRRGPFPVGVAVEAQVPADWYATGETPAKVRVAAIGHGGLFVGGELSPVKQSLLVNVSNWLLGRDDRLPHEAAAWTYPRVQLTERESRFWQLGTLLALPALFLFLGSLVLLGRRYR